MATDVRAQSEPRLFVVTPGPHLHAAISTPRIMWQVNAALAPAALWGVFVFGPVALSCVIGCIAGAVCAEWLACRLQRRRSTATDGSAVCTGLLLAMTLPPALPAWQGFLGGAFAILLAKSLFGGLGYNIFNPALVGRAFLLATFPVAMTARWIAPRPWFSAPLDAVTTATPLAALKEHGLAAAQQVITTPHGLWSGLVWGFRPGSLGEVSVVLVAVGAVYLLARRVITLAIPLSVFAGVACVTVFTGHAALHLLSGGLWLGAFFMATDYVTSPVMTRGQLVYGFVIGVLTAVIRVYGGYPEGICYAILLANALTPALNTWFRTQRVAPRGTPS